MGTRRRSGFVALGRGPAAAAALLAVCLFAPGLRADLADDLARLLAHERYRLANGLEVILREDHGAPVVGLSIWVHAGSADNPPGKAGLAHLVEHLMFAGSAHAPQGHNGWVGGLGPISAGATTSLDHTRYFETVPAGSLEGALWLESDRLGFLSPNDAALVNAKEAIKNERRQHIDNRPYAAAYQKLWREIFPPPHPYTGAAQGDDADMDALTLQDAAAFLQSYYAPANVTLALVGDFRTQWVHKLVDKYFGSLPARPLPPAHRIPAVRLEREVVLRHAESLGNLAAVWVAWPSPPLFAPGDAAGDVLATILAGGRSSRLGRRLDAALLTRGSFASQRSYLGQSYFQVGASIRRGREASVILAAIDEELARLRSAGPTAEEVAEAVARRELVLLRRFDGEHAVGRIAEHLQFYNQGLGQPDGVRQNVQRYRAVTAADVRAFAAEVLAPGRRVVLIAEPTHPGGGVLGPLPGEGGEP